MCGDNIYVDLRTLTAIELYLNSEAYSKHPSFISLISKHSKVFSSIDTILAISVSHNALDSNKTKGELIQNEAIYVLLLSGLDFYVPLVLHHISLFKFSAMLLQKHWVNIKVQTNVQSINGLKLVYSILSVLKRFICCFATTLVSFQFLLCIITVFL